MGHGMDFSVWAFGRNPPGATAAALNLNGSGHLPHGCPAFDSHRKMKSKLRFRHETACTGDAILEALLEST